MDDVYELHEGSFCYYFFLYMKIRDSGSSNQKSGFMKLTCSIQGGSLAAVSLFLLYLCILFFEDYVVNIKV